MARGLGSSLKEAGTDARNIKYIKSRYMRARQVVDWFSPPPSCPLNQNSYHTLTQNLRKVVMISSVSDSIEGATKPHSPVMSYLVPDEKYSN
jgi:hypothetical protein